MSLMAIPLEAGGTVSGLLDLAEDPVAFYVLAHGAGGGMRHPFMQAAATGLAARGVSVLRFHFPFMEAGSRRPDRPAVAHAAVRAAFVRAAALAPGLPLFAGGKSFGGRMTSQAQAASPLPGIRGPVFLGFPLHPAGKPSAERAGHLDAVDEPMLFLQGTRDALAEVGLLRAVSDSLQVASLSLVEDADQLVSRARQDRAFRRRRAKASVRRGGELDARHGWPTRAPTAHCGARQRGERGSLPGVRTYIGRQVRNRRNAGTIDDGTIRRSAAPRTPP